MGKLNLLGKGISMFGTMTGLVPLTAIGGVVSALDQPGADDFAWPDPYGPNAWELYRPGGVFYGLPLETDSASFGARYGRYLDWRGWWTSIGTHDEPGGPQGFEAGLWRHFDWSLLPSGQVGQLPMPQAGTAPGAASGARSVLPVLADYVRRAGSAEHEVIDQPLRLLGPHVPRQGSAGATASVVSWSVDVGGLVHATQRAQPKGFSSVLTWKGPQLRLIYARWIDRLEAGVANPTFPWIEPWRRSWATWGAMRTYHAMAPLEKAKAKGTHVGGILGAVLDTSPAVNVVHGTRAQWEAGSTQLARDAREAWEAKRAAAELAHAEQLEHWQAWRIERMQQEAAEAAGAVYAEIVAAGIAAVTAGELSPESFWDWVAAEAAARAQPIPLAVAPPAPPAAPPPLPAPAALGPGGVLAPTLTPDELASSAAPAVETRAALGALLVLALMGLAVAR